MAIVSTLAANPVDTCFTTTVLMLDRVEESGKGLRA
jgi:hypothetical protein